jgi:hypothetical protein
MKVYVASKGKHLPLKRRARSASSGFPLEIIPLDALARALPTIAEGSLLYLDVTGLGAREKQRRISQLAEHPGLLFGILDAAGKVSDPGAVFHAGAVDYLGKTLARTGLTARRVEDVLAFARATGKAAGGPFSWDGVASARGWEDIVEGREYPFFLLFVEADDAEEMKLRYQAENLTRALETFRLYVERAVEAHGGRLWLWSGFGGVALFPPTDGGFPPFVAAFRLLLSRPFYDVEESPWPNYLSFRMAMSHGSLVYRKRRTGGIISDALNTIFHLGQRYTKRGQFTLTAEVVRLVPGGLREFCVPCGTFEGHKIYRVRAPLYPATQREGEWAREV